MKKMNWLIPVDALLASISFGFWQNSFDAGIFVLFVLFTILLTVKETVYHA